MIEAIIFDYARTIVNPEANPPALYPDAKEVLEDLKTIGVRMALVSRGQNEDLRRHDIAQLGLTKYFNVVYIVGQEADKDFRPVIAQLGVSATRCIVVGDRVKQEIKYGNLVGAKTVWLRREGEKFTEEYPQTPEEEPKNIIFSLEELIPLIEAA